MSRYLMIISLTTVLLFSVSICADCRDTGFRTNPFSGCGNYSGGAIIIGTILSIFPSLDKKTPQPTPTSQWVRSHVRCDGTRIPGHWEESKETNVNGHFYKCWVTERGKQTFVWRTHLKKNEIAHATIALKPELLKSTEKSDTLQEKTNMYITPDSRIIDNVKPVEDGQSFWRRVLLEKHKVIPPLTAELSALIYVEGKLDNAKKSGENLRLPDGWKRMVNDQTE